MLTQCTVFPRLGIELKLSNPASSYRHQQSSSRRSVTAPTYAVVPIDPEQPQTFSYSSIRPRSAAPVLKGLFGSKLFIFIPALRHSSLATQLFRRECFWMPRFPDLLLDLVNCSLQPSWNADPRSDEQLQGGEQKTKGWLDQRVVRSDSAARKTWRLFTVPV